MARTDRNELLGDTVPSGREVQTDVLEWWCHVVLQDCNSPELYSRRVEGCYQIMEELGETIGDQGRLFNRTQLATLCCDLLNRPIVSKEETEEDEDEDDDTPLSKLSPEKWAEYRETLELVRSNLLRKDANISEGQDVNEEVDTDLEALAKFREDYQAVKNLLELCEVVARFQSNIDKLSTSKDTKQKALLQIVESAVGDYKKGLQKLQLDKEEELTSFLLADMYQSKPKDLAQRLQEHLLEVMTKDNYEYGYSQITQKTRRLLCRWQSQVLDVPKLCRLGYGGFVKRRSSILDDNVSVSSWGVDEEEFKQRKQVQEEEDLVGYATAADDATADEAEANAAFAFSTQPPAPDSPDEKQVNDGDKKPRAKRKKSQQHQEEKESDNVTRMTRSKDLSRRSSRRMATRASPARNKSMSKHSLTTSSPRQKTLVAKAPPKSPGMESLVCSEEEVSPQTNKDGDVIMTQPDSSPPRKKAAVAHKPLADDESITEPESRPPRKKAAVAHKPPAESETESETSPPPKKKASLARRPRPAAAHHPPRNPTVIEWSESEDDEVPPPTRVSIGRRRSGEMPRGIKKPKAPKKRRPFTDEEKEAIRAGVYRFGVGNWKWIRINSDRVLLSRTNVNIKDCYRNMKNRGEI